MVLRSSFAAGGAALALGLGLASAVHAQTTARDTPSSNPRAPTADEAAALAAKAPAGRGMLTGKINPQAVVHPDGMVELELDDSTMMFSVARRNPDGSISTYCVPGAKNAERLVKGTATVAKTGKGQAHEHK